MALGKVFYLLVKVSFCKIRIIVPTYRAIRLEGLEVMYVNYTEA